MTLPVHTLLLLLLLLLATLSLSLPLQAASAMQELDDAALGAVAGQQGIALSLEFRINAEADGDPLPDPDPGTSSHEECPDLAGLTGGSSCRLALSFADRAGMWIVMKNYRGTIRLTNIRLDAANLRATNSPHRDLASYMGGYDPNGKPAIQLTSGPWATAFAAFPTTPATYYSFLNQDSYADFATSIDIEKLSAEYDCGSAVNAATGIYVTGCSGATPGWNGVDRVPGYLRNAIGGAPIALRVADGISSGNLTPNTPAQIRLDGRLQVYGY